MVPWFKVAQELNGCGVRDCTKEHFEMCNNTFQEVYNNLGSRIPFSSRTFSLK